MAKKNDSVEDPKKLEDKAFQEAIEEKVRLMMDPKIDDRRPKPQTIEPEAIEPETKTAPVVAGSAVDSTAEYSGDIPVNSEEATIDGDDQDEKLEEPQSDDANEDSTEPNDAQPEPEAEAKPAPASPNQTPKSSKNVGDIIKKWWANPHARKATIFVALVLLISSVVVPGSRYFLLNTAGVRSSASLVVLDDSTQQPLKNVVVTVGQQTGTTDDEGEVRLSNLRLGANNVVLEKRAFAKVERKIIIGWGSNPLGNFKLSPVGSQYSFMISDYLSGKPIDKAEALVGDFSAFSDEKGRLKLTLEPSEGLNEVEVTIKADQYREEKVILSLDSKNEVALAMVPSRSHVFVSKRSGKYDVYKIDADGKNETLLFKGTGTERNDLVLAHNPSKEYAALVSTRENVRNKDGFLLSTLTVINTKDASTVKVAQSERVQVVDWTEDRLVYVQIASGASASDPKRHRLMSYSLEKGESKELAASNYFNDVLAINGFIYFAPSSAYTSEKTSFYKISADGSGKQTVYAQEVWNAFRTEYDKLVITAGQDWYEYRISDSKVMRLNGEPGSLKSNIYVDSPDHQQSSWVDQRDGKGVLLAYDNSKKEDRQIIEKSGLSNPIRWLSNSAVVFRVSTSQETADYVISLDGGEARKLRDVTNTSGIDQWYYY